MTKETDNFHTDRPSFGMDDGFDSYMQNTPPTRTTNIKDFARGVVSGAATAMTDSRNIQDMVNKTMPTGYGRAVSDALEIRRAGRQLYDEARREYGQVEASLRSVSLQAEQSFGAYMPGGMKRALGRFGRGGQPKARAWTEADAQAEQISRTLADLFAEQSEQLARGEAREVAREAMQAEAETRSSTRLIDALRGIDMRLQRMVAFNDTIETNTKRKHTEIMMKTYFINAQSLQVQRQQLELQSTGLRLIADELRKPDILKLREHEKTRGVHGAEGERRGLMSMFGSRNSEFRNIADNMIKEGSTAIRTSIRSLGSILGMAGLGMSMSSMGGPSNKYQTAGNFLGGMLPDIIGMFSGDIRKATERSNRLRKHGADWLFTSQNLRSTVAGMAGEDNWRGAGSRLLMQLMGDDRARRDVKLDSIQSINAPASWRRQDSKSLNEVIPGLLGRILQGVTEIRTGKPADLIEYDFSRNKFSTASQLSKDVVRDMMQREGGVWVKRDTEDLVDYVGGSQLAPKTRRQLGKQLLKDNYARKMPSAERLTNPETWSDFSPGEAQDIAAMFQRHFEGDEHREKELDFSNRYNALGGSLRSHQNYFQDHIDSGLGKYLDEAGLIRDGRIDADALLDRYMDTDYDPVGPQEPTREEQYQEIMDDIAGRANKKFGISRRMRRAKRRTAVRAGRFKTSETRASIKSGLTTVGDAIGTAYRTTRNAVSPTAREAANLVDREELRLRLLDYRTRVDDGRIEPPKDLDLDEVLELVETLDWSTDEGQEFAKALREWLNASTDTKRYGTDYARKHIVGAYEASKDTAAKGADYLERKLTEAYRETRDTVGDQYDQSKSKGRGLLRGAARASKRASVAATRKYRAVRDWVAQRSESVQRLTDPADALRTGEDDITDSVDAMNVSMATRLDSVVENLQEMVRLENERNEREKGPRKGSAEDLLANRTKRKGTDLDTPDTRLDSVADSEGSGGLFGSVVDKAKDWLGLAGLGASFMADVSDITGKIGRRGRIFARKRGRGLGRALGNMDFMSSSKGGFMGGVRHGRKGAGIAQGMKRGARGVARQLNRLSTGGVKGGFKRIGRALFTPTGIKRSWRAGRRAGSAVWGAMKKTQTVGKVVDSMAWRFGKAALGVGIRGLQYGAGLAAGLLASPIGLALAGTAAVGLAGFGIYKWFTRPKLGDVSTYRYAQYGFPATNTDHFLPIFELERKLLEYVVVSTDGIPSLKGTVPPNLVTEALGIKPESEEAVSVLTRWLQYRFLPVYLMHIGILNRLFKTGDLQKVDKLKPKEKYDYHKATRFPGGPYFITDNPFKPGEPLSMLPTEVELVWKAINEKLEAKAGKEPETPEEALKKTQESEGGTSEDTATGKGDDNKAVDETDPKKLKDQTENLGEDTVNREAAAQAATKVSSTVAGMVAEIPNRIKAIDAIRYRTYGLKEMDAEKIRALMVLEEDVLTEVRVMGEDTLTWEGSITQKTMDHSASFGLFELGGANGTNFTTWFNRRFLPVLLRCATAVYKRSGTSDMNRSLGRLAPHIRLEIGAYIVSTQVESREGTQPVWRVTASPWYKYELNTDPNSTNANFDALRREVAAHKIAEEAEKKDEYVGPAEAASYRGPGSIDPAGSGAVGGRRQQIGGAATAGFGDWKGGMGQSWSPNDYGKWSVQGMHGALMRDDTVGPTDPSRYNQVSMGDREGGIFTTLPDPLATTSKSPGPRERFGMYADLVAGAAKMAGVNANELGSFLAVESGYVNHAVPGTSTAKGLGQFIDSTWAAMIQKYGPKYGIPAGTPATNPKANVLMTAEYMRENYNSLKARYPNRDVDLVDLYLAHFLGPGGVRTFIDSDPQAIGAYVMPKAASANKGVFFDKDKKRARTIGEIREWAAGRLRSTQSSFLGLDSAQVMTRSSLGQVPSPGALPHTSATSPSGSTMGSPGSTAAVAQYGGGMVHTNEWAKDTPTTSPTTGGGFQSSASQRPLTGPSAVAAQQVELPTDTVRDSATDGMDDPVVYLTRVSVSETAVTGKLTLPTGAVLHTLEPSPCFDSGEFIIAPETARGMTGFYSVTSTRGQYTGRIHAGRNIDQAQSAPRDGDVIVGVSVKDEQIVGSASAFETLRSVLGSKTYRLVVTGGQQSAMRKDGVATKAKLPTPQTQVASDTASGYGIPAYYPTGNEAFSPTDTGEAANDGYLRRTATASESQVKLLEDILKVLQTNALSPKALEDALKQVKSNPPIAANSQARPGTNGQLADTRFGGRTSLPSGVVSMTRNR